MRIATWNVNGLAARKHELELMIKSNKLDILLLSETHLTDSNSFNLNGFSCYVTNHPDMTGHAGTAVIIKNSIQHHELPEFRRDYLQATSISIDDWQGPLILSSIYCPPKHIIKEDMFGQYFKKLGGRFIMGGDPNAKHTSWGSRVIVTRGRELKKCIENHQLRAISTGEPTYWPTDINKLPDLLDFYITKGISNLYHSVESCLDGSSDHTPVLMTVSTTIIHRPIPCTLYNKKTDWNAFQDHIEDKINLRIPLKTEEDVDRALDDFIKLVQEAAWKSTPSLPRESKCNLSVELRNKVEEKRRLRRRWQQSRHPSDKSLFYKAKKQLKKYIHDLQNETLQDRLEKSDANRNDEHSLWKLTKFLSQPQKHVPPLKRPDATWARSAKEKADVFADFLQSVFKTNESNDLSTEEEIKEFLQSPQQMSLPIKPVSPKEVARQIKALENLKAPGFDLITAEILKKITPKGITLITIIFNAMLRLQYFPPLLKVSQIILVHKNGKPPNEVPSYRPISLLPILSKLFEKLLLSRLKPLLFQENIIPDHQFGFRPHHSTIEQVHRVVHEIRQTFEKKEFCSAVFLDIQQAFDRVWHAGLLYKIKKALPNTVYMLINSYLNNRLFQVKFGEECSALREIEAGVPQGSVLGPVLYTIFTADIPQSEDILCATYADDTACLASSPNPVIASEKLQTHLNKIDQWLDKWRIKASPSKSVHITFTLRRGDCPPVTMKGEILPHKASVKYLGCHLDRGLYWKTHILAKRDALKIRYRNLHWMLNRTSRLSLSNKILVYNSVLKPIWTYASELWGSACATNIQIIQRFQNKVLRNICAAPWFTKNEEIHEYLEVTTVKEEIENRIKSYKGRLERHINPLAIELLNTEKDVVRLKRPNLLNIK